MNTDDDDFAKRLRGAADESTVHHESGAASQRIGNYKLLQRIGEGGMGAVWMAEQIEPIKRRIALKLIKTGRDSKPIIARFEAERQALALMDHPSIAKILDGGTTESGQPYFVMELVQGMSITKYCDKHKLGLPERLALFTQVCNAIQHAHQKGIIHRDLKPANILVGVYDGKPVPKVIDFGLAKALDHQSKLTDKTLFTEFGAVVGTLQYMSPEQADLDAIDIDTRADIYALGVLLYELLTGSTPIEAATLKQLAVLKVLETIRETDPPRPSARLSSSSHPLNEISSNRRIELSQLQSVLRGDLDWIVMKALEKDRTRRYESASGFAADIERYLTDQPVVARPPTTAYKLSKFIRKNRGSAIVAGTILFLLLTGLLGTSLGLLEAQRKTKLAKLAEQKSDAASKDAVQQRNFAESRRAELAIQANEAASVLFDYGMREYEANRFKNSFDKIRRAARLRSVDDPIRETYGRVLADRLTKGGRSWAVLQHDAPVRTIEFSADGSRLLTIAGEYLVYLWDMQTGRRICEPLQHPSYVTSAKFNLDCSRIATSSKDNCVRLWNSKTGSPVGVPMQSKGSLLQSEFSPTTNQLITVWDSKACCWDEINGTKVCESNTMVGAIERAEVGSDGIVCLHALTKDFLWNSVSGELINDLTKSERTWLSPDSKINLGGTYDRGGRYILTLRDQISGENVGVPIQLEHTLKIKISPDSRLVAIGSHRNVHLWDTQTGKQIGVLPHHDENIEYLAFSPDSNSIATVSGYTARIWNAHSGNLLGQAMEHGSLIRWSTFSPDGRRIATRSDDEVILWDTKSGKRVGNGIKHYNRIESLKFSPDSSRLLTVSYEAAYLTDVNTGKSLGQALTHDEGVNCAAFCPDGSSLATGSDDKSVRLWRMEPYTRLGAPMRHQGIVESMDFSPDNNQLVTACWDGEARLWDGSSAICTDRTLKHQSRIHCVLFSPDGNLMATSSSDGTARLWNSLTGNSVGEVMQHGSDIYSLSFSPDSRRLATASGDGTARLWDAISGLPISESMKHVGRVTCVAFSPDGKQLATGSFDKMARLWDGETGRSLGNPMQHDGHIRAIAFSPNGKRLAVASTDKTARLWETDTQIQIGESMQHQGTVNSVEFSPDGSRLVTASDDSKARLWNGETGNAMGFSMQHRGAVSCAAFSPSGHQLVTGSDDNTARIWDGRLGVSLGQVLEHENPVLRAMYSKDGNRIATVSQTKVFLWNIETFEPTNPAEFLQAYSEVPEENILQNDLFQKEVNGFRERTTFRFREQLINDSVKHGKWFTAKFHLRQMIRAEPKKLRWKELLESIAAEEIQVTDQQGHSN